MRSDIVPGATFPDYELPDHTDVPRRLSELQGDDPLVLTLARGHYCPKERGRPSIDDLRHDLRAVTAGIRPDWDVSTPGLRDKWDAGDLSSFHGWEDRA
jgi:peroxiredoxin